jgi:NAD(P)H-dependent flavin oxidoreductase YrpB (nitropropane dioxygenase family)
MFKPLRIGVHQPRYPLIQGGMGVRISAGSLAGHVAKCGGIGLVASPGLALNSGLFDGKNYLQSNSLSLKAELQKAYQIAPDGVIGVNVMVALTDFEQLVTAAVEAGAKLLVCGAGLPLTLPGLTAHAPDVALVPIVSSVRAAQLIAKKWDKAYNRLPDAFVVEDPDTAGGHLGEKLENIGNGDYDQYATVRGVKEFFKMEYGLDLPIIAAGGIWGREDLLRALAGGADGVQMASRFVPTVECDAEYAFKQAYLDCKQEDIGLIMSPAGLPGRAIISNQGAIVNYDKERSTPCTLGCLKKCSYKESRERFCIIKSLDRAQRGEVDAGLIFCGTNAWKAERIGTVQEVFDELFPTEVPHDPKVT